MRIILTLTLLSVSAHAGDGNRLAYLDTNDSYYVSRKFPTLITPQWIGEKGVDAVVILAIDDMRGYQKWENYLRPILKRLKRIDGRAPVSIMTCRLNPNEKHLQKWIEEGVSLEVHTFDHPCPILQGGSLAKAKATYDRCVDLLASVPNMHPVAFRTPCCDSMNTPSPRMFAEIFNKVTPKGNFLTVDSSVFCTLTPNDPELPRKVVFDEGKDRFAKYLPKDRSFVNTIEDYPYPYVLGQLCWEFPCLTPSDWQAQHLHKPNNAITVRDWKAALDGVVVKKGVFNFVFHPHGWIKNSQMIEFIDHAVTKHGKKVKFLNFREAYDRICKHLLGGQTLRDEKGNDNGVRLIDVNNDGYLDVVIGNAKVKKTRIWQPKTQSWKETSFPVDLRTAGARFGVVHKDGRPSLVLHTPEISTGWTFSKDTWIKDDNLIPNLPEKAQTLFADKKGRDRGARLRDVDGDGICELILGDVGIYKWSERGWGLMPVALPKGAHIVDSQGRDAGLRFVDLNEDGKLDLVWSNENDYGVYLYEQFRRRLWVKILEGKRNDAKALPMITRKGTINGAWFHSGHLWVQNEDTSILKDRMDRRSFKELLKGVMPKAKSPEESRQCIKVRPGFVVELVASEPLVQDPISFDWGPDGKLWVVEMGDYPRGVDGKGKHGGRVRYLEDTDGDGKYDKSTILLEGLGFPSGVMAWKKGVLVSCAPEIFYAEPGKKKVVLYSGFKEGNQQHRVNGFARGLDGWIYCANGDSGGLIKSHKTGKSINIIGRDFRIKPETGEIDAQTGQTQYGRNRDDWGNWFGGNNSNPMWHFVLADHYLRRNPYVTAPNLRIAVSTQPGAAPVYPQSRTLERFNDYNRANRFTSACSPIVYRDDLFGQSFQSSTFVCEPVHNLIHREVMRAKGITFQSSRASDEKTSEFLASSDNWFRPTRVRTGPDGALWIADMYRLVIEHPQWIPLAWQKRLDLRAGHDKGRIYRVYPIGKKLRRIPHLKSLSTPQLVKALDHPNGWQRDLAQELLTERADLKSLAALREMAVNAARPLARLHALCTLDSLNEIDMKLLISALQDKHPGVRRHAIRISEGRKLSKEAREALLACRMMGDAQVRLQLIYSLGTWSEDWAGSALGQFANEVESDIYLSTALLSSVHKGNFASVVREVKSKKLLQRFLTFATRLGREQASIVFKQIVTPENGRFADWQLRAMASYLEAGSANLDLTQAAKMFEHARAQVDSERTPEARLLLAIPLLGHEPKERVNDLDRLGDLLSPVCSVTLQNAAIRALGRIPSKKVPSILLRRWRSLSPSIRTKVLSVLLERREGVIAVLEALEKKKIRPLEIDVLRRQFLLRHRDAKVRERAKRSLASLVPESRQKVLREYQAVLKMRGDVETGRALFRKHCIACHRLENVGQQVGPDLAALTDRSSSALLIALLDPNRAVEAKYLTYSAEMQNGRIHSGILTNETSTSLTLISTDGKSKTLLRSDLEEILSTGQSLMPEGLEKELDPQAVANLIAYLQQSRPDLKRKTFPKSKPTLIRPEKRELFLTSMNCSIYGSTLILETKYGNLGYWSSANDQAIWEVDVPKDGEYEVWIEWALNSSSGNRFILQSPIHSLTHQVQSTTSWDRYKKAKIGTLKLRAGRQSITMRGKGPIKGALIDLKSITLRPLGR